MSAFLCSITHVVTCATILARQTSPAPTVPSIQAFAKALRKINNRALACRYGDKPEYLPRDISAACVDAAAWLDSHTSDDRAAVACCLQYQCSEGDTDKMKEWAFLVELLQVTESRGDYSRSGIWAI